MQFLPLDSSRHDRDGFHCAEPSLDAYLRERAGQHQRDGIATTHVLIESADPTRILGYCSLAAAQMNLLDLQSTDRKRLPGYPVPAVRIARLAVSLEERGNGYGKLLLGHAMNCSMQLRAQLGVTVVFVDALDGKAADFYRNYGLRESAEHALPLYLPLGKS